MLSENTWIDSVMDNILNAILAVLKPVLAFIFSNQIITLLFWLLFINLVAIFLMKKDKQFAKDEKRRIRESTLLSVALAGGAVGMYYAMYKYKHKTLHKKFTVFVPIFIMIHFALISYAVAYSFIG